MFQPWHFDHKYCARCGAPVVEGHGDRCLLRPKQRQLDLSGLLRMPTWFERYVLRRPTVGKQAEQWLASEEAQELAEKLAATPRD